MIKDRERLADDLELLVGFLVRADRLRQGALQFAGGRFVLGGREARRVQPPDLLAQARCFDLQVFDLRTRRRGSAFRARQPLAMRLEGLRQLLHHVARHHRESGDRLQIGQFLRQRRLGVGQLVQLVDAETESVDADDAQEVLEFVALAGPRLKV